MIQIIPLALAALGTFQAVNTYQNQKDQAAAIKAQADIDRQAAAAQIERDSIAESAKTTALRDKLRRQRAVMESQYATSGVLLDGSASEILVKQRGTDEINVQNIHRSGNDKRRLMNWRAEEQRRQSLYQAKSLRRSADIGLATSLIGTGLSFGFNMGAFGSPLMSNTPVSSNTMTGQSLNMNYFSSVA